MTGEFEFIAQLAKTAGRSDAALGFQDDGAVFSIGSQKIVVVKDVVQSGVHAILQTPIEKLVQKAIRVNLSDLAAMGAKPAYFLLGLCLGEQSQLADLSQLAQTIGQEADLFNIQLIGGDTVSGIGVDTVSVTAIGLLDGAPVLRSGAKPGDDIWVSGSIGDSALALRILQNDLGDPKIQMQPSDVSWLKNRYELPMPRVQLGMHLRGIANAMIDISDGLAADLSHIARTSNVQACIDFSAIPRSAAFQNWCAQGQNIEQIWPVVSGGDDYELLFSAPPFAKTRILALAEKLDCPLCRIGQIKTGEGVHIFDKGRALDLPISGFTHF